MDTTLRATVIPRYKHDDEDATLGVDGYTTILTRRRGQGELRPYRDDDTTEWLLLKQPGVPAIAEPSDKPTKNRLQPWNGCFFHARQTLQGSV